MIVSYNVENSLMKKNDLLIFVVSAMLPISVVFFMLLTNEDMFHWFIFPVTLCGMLILPDALKWIYGRVDLFDPIGLIGLLGVHFFFLAPLLHVYWDYWMTGVLEPDDWRGWLGLMAIINALGIIIYKKVRRIIIPSKSPRKKRKIVWKINERRFKIVLFFSLIITGSLQLWFYQSQGGLLYFVLNHRPHDGSLEGMGFLFLISESFPILLIFGIAYAMRNSKYRKTILLVLATLVMFFVLKMVFGGFRGSRNNTIWALFWAAGIFHLWVKPFNKKHILMGISALLLFMYLYGFYKSGGIEGLKSVTNSEMRSNFQDNTGRTFKTIMLGDLGRSDVQAYILYKLVEKKDIAFEFDYALGRTYLGALAVPIPSAILPNPPATKVKEGTEIQYGDTALPVPGFTSSRVYGLMGEGMLNFGFVLAPFYFVILGLVVNVTRKWFLNLDRSDIRMLMLPLFLNISFLFIINDLDMIIFFLIKSATVPFIVIFLSSRRVRITPTLEQTA